MPLLDFTSFAYKRKKSYPSVDNCSGKENKDSQMNATVELEELDATPIPNKDHHGIATTIPETPTSLLPTQRGQNCQTGLRSKMRHGQKRRQCARIDSSSDDEECSKNQSTDQSCNSLFSGIHTSKRRKLSDSFDIMSDVKQTTSRVPSSSTVQLNGGEDEETRDSCTLDHDYVTISDEEPRYASSSYGGLSTNVGRVNLEKLSDLFPQHDKEYLESVLDKEGDLDKAVSELLGTSRGSPCVRSSRRARHRRVVLDTDSDSSPIATKQKSAPRRTIRRCISDSSSDSELPSFARDISGKTIDSSVKVVPNSSEWLQRPSDPKSKLQQFAYRKRNKELSSESIDCDVTSPECTHEMDKPSQQAICISDDDDDDDEHAVPVVENEHNIFTSADSKHGRRSSTHKKQAIELDCDFRENYSDPVSDDDDFSDNQKVAILDFVNNSTPDEMCDIPGFSVTKTKLLVKYRPFETWNSLVDTLVSTKGLSEQLLEGCLTLLGERKVLVKLLAKCEKISVSIHQRFSKLQETNNQEDTRDSTVTYYSQQPTVMNTDVQLKPYQVLGLNWLALLHSQGLNGILADEMGLGKTVQAISFLSHLYEQGSCGYFLVVVPASTIDNWAREFEVWCPTLTVTTYWGSQAERSQMRYDVLSEQEDCDVILTTYNGCIGQAEDRKFFRKLSLQCLILDEGHMLKNMNSQRYTHLMKIKAKRRVLLTGTPLQNNLLELMSLLSFVMPDVFQEFSAQIRKKFSRERKLDESSSYYQDQVKQAKQIMQPFMLRRLKSEVLSQLPAKVLSTEYCELTEAQQRLYTATVDRSLKVSSSETSNGSSDTVNMRMDVMMGLRKAANHPLLLRHLYNDDKLRKMSKDILQENTHRDADPALVFEDMTVMSDFELHKLCISYQSLDKYALPCTVFGQSGKCNFLSAKLTEIKEKGDRVLLFSQFTMMLDILEVFLQQEGHTFLRLDGQTPVSERQALIDDFNDKETIFMFLLSTRAGGLGINLTSANVVIIHDIDFNPYNDKQAEDRCHRVGQTRDVKVIRLVGKNTIEEDILQCAQAKLKLEQDITATSDTDEMKTLDIVSLLKQSVQSSS